MSPNRSPVRQPALVLTQRNTATIRQNRVAVRIERQNAREQSARIALHRRAAADVDLMTVKAAVVARMDLGDTFPIIRESARGSRPTRHHMDSNPVRLQRLAHRNHAVTLFLRYTLHILHGSLVIGMTRMAVQTQEGTGAALLDVPREADNRLRIRVVDSGTVVTRIDLDQNPILPVSCIKQIDVLLHVHENVQVLDFVRIDFQVLQLVHSKRDAQSISSATFRYVYVMFWNP